MTVNLPHRPSAKLRRLIAIKDLDGKVIPIKDIREGAPSIETKNVCNGCKNSLTVMGDKTKMTHDHDTYRAPAHCCSCGVHVGTITVKVSTIFGIEEDDRVLNHGRCRVY
jgi:hypothetical protein